MAIILITCAGSGVGQSIIDSLNLSGGHFLIGIDNEDNVYAHHFCNKFFQAPGIYSDNYLNFLINLSIKEKVDLIIPGHDHELLMLSQNIELFKKHNLNVLVSLPDIIEISRDKYQWSDFFGKHGCSVVKTFKISEFKNNPDNSIFPAIIKPCGGSASQGISITDSLESFKTLSNLNDGDIIQPYLFPKKDDPNYDLIKRYVKQGKFVQVSEISMQLVFSKQSKCEGIFISKNVLKNGVPTVIQPIEPESFEYINDLVNFSKVCEQYKVKGPVNIQGRITENGLICFEMNMRFTGITGNRAQFGFNEVEFLVNNFLDIPCSLGEYSFNKVGVRQVACTTIPYKQKIDSPKVITILGGGGFIGSHFVNELIQNFSFNELNIICRKESLEKYKDLFNKYDKTINIIAEDDSDIQSIYCKTDVLINFAGALAFSENLIQFQTILFLFEQVERVRKANIPLIINISSQSIYNQNLDIDKSEDSNATLTNTYTFQKILIEKMFSSIKATYPLSQVISFRLARVIGCHYSGNKSTGFFTQVIEKFMNGKPVEINPSNKTNLIHVSDVANAIIFVLHNFNNRYFPEVINLGGENISMLEYCEAVLKILEIQNSEDLIKNITSTETITSSMMNTDLLKNMGWDPEYSLEAIIKEIHNHILQFK